MELSIKNIGKIESADIKLDGITVICGENNTGKSTIGKVLFSYFNSMCDFESKIREQRIKEIKSCASKYSTDTFNLFSAWITKAMEQFTFPEANMPTIEDIKEILNMNSNIKNKKALAEELYLILNMSNENLMNEYIFRYFTSVFNGQIRNENAGSKQVVIKTSFHGGINTIKFFKSRCELNQRLPIVHCAYYINNPFVIDYLNNASRLRMSILSELDRNIIDAIEKARLEQDADKMADIFDAVANKDKLEEIKELLHRAYNGRTVRKNGLYFYNDGKNDVDFRNLSTGLKSFALIEQLLESGKLKSKDTLILDEPEIHLHPEWQLIYAELIVLLQKTFNLTILLVTHSFQFLESLKFFMDKYDIKEHGNFYTPQKSKNGYIITETDNALYDSMKSLSEPSFKLADWKFELEMEQNNGSETD